MDSIRNKESAVDDLKQFISFSVGDEEYGLELLRVKEVIRVKETTWLPKAPRYVKGIINLRGDVIPIVDLRTKFGLPETADTDATRVIVVEVDERLIGMVVDATSQVVRLPASQIEPPPPVLGGFSHEMIAGVGKVDDKLVALLNVAALLTLEESQQLFELGTADGRLSA